MGLVGRVSWLVGRCVFVVSASSGSEIDLEVVLSTELVLVLGFCAVSVAGSGWEGSAAEFRRDGALVSLASFASSNFYT